MTDDERLVAALRAELHMTSMDNMCLYFTDEKLLRITEGTYLRARVELMLAWQDVWAEIKKVYERPAVRVLGAILRAVNWLRGEKNGTGTAD